MLQYGPILAVLKTTKTNTRIRKFHTRVKLDINYSSRFVQYPHYLIACCLPHLSMVAHNCHGKALTSRQKEKPHGKKNNLTVRQKEKDSRQKEKLHSKKKKTQSKKKTSRQKKKARGKISSILRGHFNSYFFCREVVVILSAVRLLFLL